MSEEFLPFPEGRRRAFRFNYHPPPRPRKGPPPVKAKQLPPVLFSKDANTASKSSVVSGSESSVVLMQRGEKIVASDTGAVSDATIPDDEVVKFAHQTRKPQNYDHQGLFEALAFTDSDGDEAESSAASISPLNATIAPFKEEPGQGHGSLLSKNADALSDITHPEGEAVSVMHGVKKEYYDQIAQFNELEKEKKLTLSKSFLPSSHPKYLHDSLVEIGITEGEDVGPLHEGDGDQQVAPAGNDEVITRLQASLAIETGPAGAVAVQQDTAKALSDEEDLIHPDEKFHKGEIVNYDDKSGFGLLKHIDVNKLINHDLVGHERKPEDHHHHHEEESKSLAIDGDHHGAKVAYYQKGADGDIVHEGAPAGDQDHASHDGLHDEDLQLLQFSKVELTTDENHSVFILEKGTPVEYRVDSDDRVLEVRVAPQLHPEEETAGSSSAYDVKGLLPLARKQPKPEGEGFWSSLFKSKKTAPLQQPRAEKVKQVTEKVKQVKNDIVKKTSAKVQAAKVSSPPPPAGGNTSNKKPRSTTSSTKTKRSTSSTRTPGSRSTDGSVRDEPQSIGFFTHTSFHRENPKHAQVINVFEKLLNETHRKTDSQHELMWESNLKKKRQTANLAAAIKVKDEVKNEIKDKQGPAVQKLKNATNVVLANLKKEQHPRSVKLQENVPDFYVVDKVYWCYSENQVELFEDTREKIWEQFDWISDKMYTNVEKKTQFDTNKVMTEKVTPDKIWPRALPEVFGDNSNSNNYNSYSSNYVDDHVYPVYKEYNECFLFHGTKERNAWEIAQKGFNLPEASEKSKHGSRFGKAIYLAEASSKADRYTAELVELESMDRVNNFKSFTESEDGGGMNIKSNTTTNSNSRKTSIAKTVSEYYYNTQPTRVDKQLLTVNEKSHCSAGARLYFPEQMNAITKPRTQLLCRSALGKVFVSHKMACKAEDLEKIDNMAFNCITNSDEAVKDAADAAEKRDSKNSTPHFEIEEGVAEKMGKAGFNTLMADNIRLKFREFVLFDPSQILPEFIIYYRAGYYQRPSACLEPAAETDPKLVAEEMKTPRAAATPRPSDELAPNALRLSGRRKSDEQFTPPATPHSTPRTAPFYAHHGPMVRLPPRLAAQQLYGSSYGNQGETPSPGPRKSNLPIAPTTPRRGGSGEQAITPTTPRRGGSAGQSGANGGSSSAAGGAAAVPKLQLPSAPGAATTSKGRGKLTRSNTLAGAAPPRPSMENLQKKRLSGRKGDIYTENYSYTTVSSAGYYHPSGDGGGGATGAAARISSYGKGGEGDSSGWQYRDSWMATHNDMAWGAAHNDGWGMRGSGFHGQGAW
ncbi:unnamed protein product [Amoebophrya sp. A120]|nr:unnamed protein product [Amoebophrya sp. A120]|eukprot:GSA120T00022460001.1